MTANDRRTPLAAGLDTFAVVLFVSIGRREHERDSAISGLISTAAPFLIALAIAWLALRVWQRPTEVRSGIAIWAVVVLVGMLLRHFLFDDGTAASFVIASMAAIVANAIADKMDRPLFQPVERLNRAFLKSISIFSGRGGSR